MICPRPLPLAQPWGAWHFQRSAPKITTSRANSAELCLRAEGLGTPNACRAQFNRVAAPWEQLTAHRGVTMGVRAVHLVDTGDRPSELLNNVCSEANGRWALIVAAKYNGIDPAGA
jgi:hypothetical protein